MQNILTTGTKIAKKLNLFNYFGLNLKTVFDFRDQKWQKWNLFWPDFYLKGTRTKAGNYETYL